MCRCNCFVENWTTVPPLRGKIIPTWLTRVLSPNFCALFVRFPGSAGVATRLPTTVDMVNLPVAPLSVPATPRIRRAVDIWPCLYIPWGNPVEVYKVYLEFVDLSIDDSECFHGRDTLRTSRVLFIPLEMHRIGRYFGGDQIRQFRHVVERGVAETDDVRHRFPEGCRVHLQFSQCTVHTSVGDEGVSKCLCESRPEVVSAM